MMNEFSNAGINISKVSLQPTQMPSDQNGYTAVVNAGIHTNQCCFEGIGAVQPNDVDGENHPQTLLDQATGKALANAAGLAIMVMQTQGITQNAPIAESQQANNQIPEQGSFPPPQNKFHHSTTRPASERQMNLVSNCENFEHYF